MCVCVLTRVAVGAGLTYRLTFAWAGCSCGPREHFVAPDVVVANSMEDALRQLKVLAAPGSAAQPSIERVFVLGGRRAFASALASPLCDSIYVTRILNANVACDEHVPSPDASAFTLVEEDEEATEGQWMCVPLFNTVAGGQWGTGCGADCGAVVLNTVPWPHVCLSAFTRASCVCTLADTGTSATNGLGGCAMSFAQARAPPPQRHDWTAAAPVARWAAPLKPAVVPRAL